MVIYCFLILLATRKRTLIFMVRRLTDTLIKSILNLLTIVDFDQGITLVIIPRRINEFLLSFNRNISRRDKNHIQRPNRVINLIDNT